MARPKNTVPTATDFDEALKIDDANERSSELAKLDLTEGQKAAAQDAARKDFLDGGRIIEDEPTETKPLTSRSQKLIDELNSKGINVGYPSDQSKWTDATYARLEKLNK